jgi:hypothetical protein
MKQIILSSVVALAAMMAVAVAGVTHGAAQGAAIATGGDTDGLHVEIRDLKREEGGTVMLRFLLINDDQADAANLYVEQVALIDIVNKKKYLVIHGSDGICYCSSTVSVRINSGKRVSAWAKFAAPPVSVQKVTVLIPGMEPIDGVPVTGP